MTVHIIVDDSSLLKYKKNATYDSNAIHVSIKYNSHQEIHMYIDI